MRRGTMAHRQLPTRIIRALGGGVVVAALVGGTALAADQSVAISGFSYSPASVTVSVGDTVTWTNSDAQAHTATADDASWDTGNIAGSGGTDAVTFATAGTFPYHCDVHPQMTGTVTVQAAAATTAPGAGATTPPTDASPAETNQGSLGGLQALLILFVVWAVAMAVVLRRFATVR
jgi:plastocyanin